MASRVPLGLSAALLAACTCAAGSVRSHPDAAAASAPRPLALERHLVRWDPSARAAAIAEGRAVIERLECTRCHVVDDVPAAGAHAHCVNCHVSLEAATAADPPGQTLASRDGENTLRRPARVVEHFRAVPDLSRIGRRLRPDWIGRYVAEPFDVRPTMQESMVRIRLDESDVRAIVRYFAAVAEVADPYATATVAPADPELPRDEARIARGRELFEQRGCNACHYVGNIRLGRTAEEIRAAGIAARLAPNLRFVRERMHPDVVVDWILDPERVAPGTAMPNLRLSVEEAEAIRDFLWLADPELEPTPPKADFRLPPALARPVRWEEVQERVLRRACVHCHMNDHERDRGPGNAGGWGWPAERVRFRTYEALVEGMPGIENRHWSILETWQGATMPLILEVMLRRRDEERRDYVLPFHDHERPRYADHEPGMPMGLPAMSDEDIAIVRTWIEQGCPGPTRVTGTPGITDGFAVPDGPIADNQGCHVRPAAARRPDGASPAPPAQAEPRPRSAPPDEPRGAGAPHGAPGP